MNKRTTTGFTLIELMIVVAIIAILAAIALPAYQDYVIRAKITEGITAVTPAKHAVSEGFETNGMSGVTSAVGEYPAGNTTTASKYVRIVQILGGGAAAIPGEIQVTFEANLGNGLPTGLTGSTLVFTPYVATGTGAAATFAYLSAAAVGSIDWGCSSLTHAQSTTQGMPAGTFGTVPPQYAPSQCR